MTVDLCSSVVYQCYLSHSRVPPQVSCLHDFLCLERRLVSVRQTAYQSLIPALQDVGIASMLFHRCSKDQPPVRATDRLRNPRTARSRASKECQKAARRRLKIRWMETGRRQRPEDERCQMGRRRFCALGLYLCAAWKQSRLLFEICMPTQHRRNNNEHQPAHE